MKTRKKTTKKRKASPAQLAWRKKFAAKAKSGAFKKSAKKRNGKTIVKAKRVVIIQKNAKKKAARKNPKYTVEAIPKYTSTVKESVSALTRGSAVRKVKKKVAGPKNIYRYRVEKNPAFEIHKTLEATKRGNQAGWLLGTKFYAKRAGKKDLPGGSVLDLNSGLVYQRVENPKRKAKGNPAIKAGDQVKDAYGKWHTVIRVQGNSIYVSGGTIHKSKVIDVRPSSRKKNVQLMTGDGQPMRASWDYDPVKAGESRQSRADYFSRPHVIGGKKVSGAKLKKMVEQKQHKAVVAAQERLNKARASRDAERIEKAKRHLSETREKVRAAKVTGGSLKTDKQTASRRTARHQTKAEAKARKATTTRLASRSLDRSGPKKTKRNPIYNYVSIIANARRVASLIPASSAAKLRKAATRLEAVNRQIEANLYTSDRVMLDKLFDRADRIAKPLSAATDREDGKQALGGYRKKTRRNHYGSRAYAVMVQGRKSSTSYDKARTAQWFEYGEADTRAQAEHLAEKAKTFYKRVRIVKRNPNADTKAAYESFQGKPSTKSTSLNFPNGTPANVYKLGTLHSITLQSGAVVKPAGKTVWLCADTKGKLHLGTSGERLVNAPKGALGKVKEVEYITTKPHLGDSKPTRYYHELGEETGQKPTLYSDGAGGLVFKGGATYVRSDGIHN